MITNNEQAENVGVIHITTNNYIKSVFINYNNLKHSVELWN